jgi:hypothetical protein
MLVFASPEHNLQRLLTSLKSGCNPGVLGGATSAGEFGDNKAGQGAVSVFAIKHPDMRFRISVGKNISGNPQQAAAEVVAGFSGINTSDFPYRVGILMADCLGGYMEEFISHLTLLTGGKYQFFGGGAGDDGKFKKTYVLAGTEAFENAAVGIEVLSLKPLGIGAQHSWKPVGSALRVTEAKGSVLRSLNAEPAADVFTRHAKNTNQPLNEAEPLPFFLHNILGIQIGTTYKLRVPLSILPDRSVACAAELPVGTVSHIMETNSEAARCAGKEAVLSAMEQMDSQEIGGALFFDCVATRLRMGKEFGGALQGVQETLGLKVPLVGCNTYGQIVRMAGQYHAFHNCTAVVCLFPK